MHVPRNNLPGGGKRANPCGLTKRCTSATKRGIPELSGNLSYSTVAKMDRSISDPLAEDYDLRGFIERMQGEYSLFKAGPRVPLPL